MAVTVSREIRLRRRPVGLPQESDFELVTVPLPELHAGEALVRNLYMSVDPYMRGRMTDQPSYVQPFQIGQPLDGGCVGQVVQAQSGTLQVGDYVLGRKGWREYYTATDAELTKIDPGVAPVQAYLGILGMPGLTAYVGLLDIGQPRAGETVFVSAAAGAVGTVVCQIAKLKGCRVVGSAGSPAKVAWLRDVAGVDAALNYREAASLSAELGKHCPHGIDVYFENVGGAHLDAALEHMNPFGRVVLCGMIAHYNEATPSSGPQNLRLAVRKRLTLKGFIVSDHLDRQAQFYADMRAWIAAGQIKWQETIIEGLENAPRAFIGLFRGENLGKMLVRLSHACIL
ncbi:MAG: NADP-dependent oxidoreductase [candidate division KSB1 bacterium]|nr:NADP-dependent oxidoreductase [candidate division KSB1 bacterium]